MESILSKKKNSLLEAPGPIPFLREQKARIPEENFAGRPRSLLLETTEKWMDVLLSWREEVIFADIVAWSRNEIRYEIYVAFSMHNSFHPWHTYSDHTILFFFPWVMCTTYDVCENVKTNDTSHMCMSHFLHNMSHPVRQAWVFKRIWQTYHHVFYK